MTAKISPDTTIETVRRCPPEICADLAHTGALLVGAAVVSHHPGLVQPKEIRVQRGNGRDSDLIEGFDRVRAKIDDSKVDAEGDLGHGGVPSRESVT